LQFISFIRSLLQTFALPYLASKLHVKEETKHLLIFHNMSSSVFLSNVDDYFAPSQACVNPLFTGSSSSNKKDDEANKKKKEENSTNVVIPRQLRVRQRRRQQQPQEEEEEVVSEEPTTAASTSIVARPKSPDTTTITTQPTNNDSRMKTEKTSSMDMVDPVVKASIADCLACSGCVTTAETVLLEEKHSLDLLRQRFRVFTAAAAAAVNHVNSSNNNDANKSIRNDNDTDRLRPMVMTISPAAWADLARHLNLLQSSSSSSSSTSSHHQHALLQRQWTTLLDQTFTGLALVLDGNVPLQWSLLQAAQEFCHAHRSAAAAAAAAARATSTLASGSATSSSSSLPLLVSSSCPAVVCLVEKSIHKAVPHLSTTKSAMSMAGAYLRNTTTTAAGSSSRSHDDMEYHRHQYRHLRRRRPSPPTRFFMWPSCPVMTRN
jgi:Iron only hydrogenase large subunit, C-terminal domain